LRPFFPRLWGSESSLEDSWKCVLLTEVEPLGLHLFNRKTKGLRAIVESFFPSLDFLKARAFVSRVASRTIYIGQFTRRATLEHVVAIISHETLHSVLLGFGDDDAAITFQEGSTVICASCDTASVALDDMPRRRHNSFPAYDGLYSRDV
jgi:hypothetical protein